MKTHASRNKYFLILIIWVICAALVLTIACKKQPSKVLKMSTTTSTLASGLLDILLPEFEKDTGIQVKVIAKGTGAAIRDGIDGNVDVIFVHAKQREEDFVKEGYGTKRYAVMHNDFIILGPAKDPAGINGSNDAVTAFKKIAGAEAIFISRGDDSGTHTKEQEIWKATNIPLVEKTTSIMKNGEKVDVTAVQPDGSEKWYLSIGQGMGKALTFADEKQAYLLADRGTFLKFKYGSDNPIGLDILCEGDSILMNPYGIIPISKEKHPQAQYDMAMEFVDWILSEKGQSMIENYKLHGKQLFYPDGLK